MNKKRIKKEVKKERDDLEDRHEKEKSRLLFSENDEIILAKLSLEEKEEESIEVSKEAESEKNEEAKAQVEKVVVESKLSKTAKRRLKKEQEEKERKERIKAAIDEEKDANNFK